MTEAATPTTNASRQWWVQVRGNAYGPYSMPQMTGFVAEGRIRPATLVSDQKEGAWIEARQVVGLMTPLHPKPANDATDAANVFVHAEIASGAWHAFTAALEGMGAMCNLSPGLWVVRTRHSAGVIRNTLSQTLERGDRFVVIDSTRDRLAWFNLGPEVDVRLARVWNAPLHAEQQH